MLRLPPRSTRTDTLFPYTTLFRSPLMSGVHINHSLTEPLALYIHWPFCVSKCPYCDFNSHVGEAVDKPQWRDALLADMALEAGPANGRPRSLTFCRGVAPSLLPLQTYERCTATGW